MENDDIKLKKVLRDMSYSLNHIEDTMADDREILIDDILYDKVLKMKYAISEYNLTDKQIQDKILELIYQATN